MEAGFELRPLALIWGRGAIFSFAQFFPFISLLPFLLPQRFISGKPQTTVYLFSTHLLVTCSRPDSWLGSQWDSHDMGRKWEIQSHLGATGGGARPQEPGCYGPEKHFPKYEEFCTHFWYIHNISVSNLTLGKGMLVVQKFQNRNNVSQVSERKESIATL